MSAGLRVLLEHVIDYAGIFPPASLSLAVAIRNYASYCNSADAWMLGRFICPAARLVELTPFEELFHPGPCTVSALGRGGATTSEFLAGLRTDLDAIAAFRERHGERVVVDTYEVRLPLDVLPPAPVDAAVKLLQYAADLIDAHGPPVLTPFFEAPPAAVDHAVSALAQGRHFNVGVGPTRCRPSGLKLRCGGIEAAAFPSSAEIAHTLAACHAVGVKLKCTAGLHHPFRRFDPSVNTRMHGFINVFVAGVLAHAHGPSEDMLRAIVEEEGPAQFACDDSGCRWRDLHATPEEVCQARQHLVLSFGSCSFDEPRDDLRQLGWLR